MSQELIPSQPSQNRWDIYDLAQQASEVQTASLAASYTALHDKLNSVLVTNTTNAIEQDATIRKQNMRLLNAFRGILPVVGTESDSQNKLRHVFTVEDMMTAHMIQSNTIWDGRVVKGFIIGKAPSPNTYYRRGGRLLCLPPKPERGLCAVDIAKKITFANIAVLRDELLEKNTTEAVVAAIYDLAEKKFKIRSSPIRICSAAVMLWESNSLAHARYYGIHARTESDGEHILELGPSNQEMASYDIFGHLGRLAALFGVSGKYQKILEEQGKVEQALATSEPSTPIIKPDARTPASIDPTLYNGNDLR